MFKSVSLFSRKKTHRPFKNFYAEWIETLKTTLLPLLRHSMSTTSSLHLLATHVDAIHTHFQSYYSALDLAASSQNDVAQLLYPDYRNPLEIPFLWLGDLHPYLFTNLLRSFLNDEDDEYEDKESDERLDIDLAGKNWEVVTAWESPLSGLTSRVEQIECGLRLMVPAISARFRDAQKVFVERLGMEWGRREKEDVKGVIEEAMEVEMDEMTGVFLDANRLRRSVLSDIMGVTSVYQAALFLEGLAQFIVGFREHELLGQFDRCKMVINS